MRGAVLLVAMLGSGCGQPGKAAPADTGAVMPDADPSGDTAQPGIESFEITPTHATLFIDLAGGTAKPAVQEYLARRTYPGAPVDVTLETTFRLDDPSGR